jgi:hypothetical protein
LPKYSKALALFSLVASIPAKLKYARAISFSVLNPPNNASLNSFSAES